MERYNLRRFSKDILIVERLVLPILPENNRSHLVIQSISFSMNVSNIFAL